MSAASRRRTRGSGFAGPLVGSSKSGLASGTGSGPLEGIPASIIDRITSPYKVWYEDFRENKLDGQVPLSGWTVSDTGGGSPTEIVPLDGSRALVLAMGGSADDGVELQYDIVPAAAMTGTPHRICPEITSSTTLMDGQEIFFQVRMASTCDSATDNDSKFLLGFFTKDTSLLSVTTGLPTVAAGGGFGFHKAELGAVTAVSTEAAITAAGTALVPAVSELAQTVTVPNWHTYAARCRIVDADAGTGQTTFWYDGIERLTLDTIPFDSTEVYSFSMAFANGPNQLTGYEVDYIMTGITRPGLTWPYTDGTIY